MLGDGCDRFAGPGQPGGSIDGQPLGCDDLDVSDPEEAEEEREPRGAVIEVGTIGVPPAAATM